MARRSTVHQIVTSRKVPKTCGPHAQAVQVISPGSMLFVSGQLPWESPGGQIFVGPIKRQTELVLTHLKNIIVDAKFSLNEVVKCTLYVLDTKHLEVIWGVYQKFFIGQLLPPQTVIQVAALPEGAGICIDAVAIKPTEQEFAGKPDAFPEEEEADFE